jgi:hypothetical protein
MWSFLNTLSRDDLLLFAKLVETLTGMAKDHHLPAAQLESLIQLDCATLDAVLKRGLYPMVDETVLVLHSFASVEHLHGAHDQSVTVAPPFAEFIDGLDFDAPVDDADDNDEATP